MSLVIREMFWLGLLFNFFFFFLHEPADVVEKMTALISWCLCFPHQRPFQLAAAGPQSAGTRVPQEVRAHCALLLCQVSLSMSLCVE